MYFIKGTPVIYNGEEIAMENYPFKNKEDFKDVNAKMMFENSTDINKTFEHLKNNSRDNSRTVMQWTNENYAGFSNTLPWTYVNENYKNCNVESQKYNNNSMLNNYKLIINLRKFMSEIIQKGTYKFLKNNKYLGYEITFKNSIYYIISNLNSQSNIFNKNFDKILYSNFDFYNKTLKPYQIIITEKTTK